MTGMKKVKTARDIPIRGGLVPKGTVIRLAPVVAADWVARKWVTIQQEAKRGRPKKSDVDAGQDTDKSDNPVSDADGG